MSESFALSKRKIKGVPEHWQNYLLCILFHMGLPFLPIFFEYVISGSVEGKSLMLFTAMYSLAIGISSASPLLLGLSIAISIFFSVFYGLATSGESITTSVTVSSFICLSLIFFTHLLERYNMHVIDRSPFWSFSNGYGEKK